MDFVHLACGYDIPEPRHGNILLPSPNGTSVVIIYGSSDSERRLLDKLPGEVDGLDMMGDVRKEFKHKHENASGWFAGVWRWNYKRQIDKIDQGMKDPLLSGAAGENGVLERLAALDDSYHVFCDLRISLPYMVRYNGQRNLMSAQMDLVVACSKGVFMIEVKNWSDEYARDPKWSPHEQTERAGRVLWITLQNAVKDVRVTDVLLSIRGNIRYDPNYRAVMVSDPDRIVGFVKNRPDVLGQQSLARVLKLLKDL